MDNCVFWYATQNNTVYMQQVKKVWMQAYMKLLWETTNLFQFWIQNFCMWCIHPPLQVNIQRHSKHSCRKLLSWQCVTESLWWLLWTDIYTCNEFSSYHQTVLFQVLAATAWWLYLHKGSQFSGLLSMPCLAHTHFHLPKPTNTK